MEAQMEAVLSSLPAEKQQAVDALHRLMAGNRRFVQGLQEGCAAPVERRLELRESQSPCAIVITCSDSRCPPELLFDQGYGDIFVIRVAGNVVNQHVLGSISYALQHLHTRLILVLGHTNCGAIKASVADFVDSTTKRLREREEAEAEAAAAAAAEAARLEDEQRHQAKESRTFFSRLFALFGGREEVAKLVRTASFRDAEHAAAPINSIVLSIQPAVKDVVWALLTSPPEAIGAYAPLSTASSTCGGSTRDASSLRSSPNQSPCSSPRAGSLGGEGNWDGGGGTGDGVWVGDAALGGGKGGFGSRGWGGAGEEDVAAGPEGDGGMHQALDLPPCLWVMRKIMGEREAARKIMADLKRNSSHWALCSSSGGFSSDGEEEGAEGEGDGGEGQGQEEGGDELERGHRHGQGHHQHAQHHGHQHGHHHGHHHGQHAQQHGPWHPAGAPGEEDHHLAPLRWDCDALDGAITDKPEVCEHVLHQTLADPNVNICLHTALRCSKVVNSVIYQNVRRQGGEVWEAMRTWVDGGEMDHVVMATAVYDLASGRVDVFGLQTC